MKRTSFDDKRDKHVADDYLGKHLPCSVCGAATSKDDLSRLGARCQACYERYCAASNPSWWPNRQLTSAEREAVIRKAKNGLAKLGQRPDDPKRWAKALQARELAGERLSLAQQTAWRAALREHLTTEENEA